MQSSYVTHTNTSRMLHAISCVHLQKPQPKAAPAPAKAAGSAPTATPGPLPVPPRPDVSHFGLPQDQADRLSKLLLVGDPSQHFLDLKKIGVSFRSLVRSIVRLKLVRMEVQRKSSLRLTIEQALVLL
jgi:hypothetical protein